MELETIEQYEEYCSDPLRGPQRAKCHLVWEDDIYPFMPDYDPDLEYDPASDYDSATMINAINQFVNKLLDDSSHVRERDHPGLDLGRTQISDVKRGDIIAFGPSLGYRNQGKYIYDGKNVISLDYDGPDDYGSVPNEFQVLVRGQFFGPRYWSDLISHNRYIPFNFAERLPGMTVDNVSQINDKYNCYYRYVLPFYGANNEVYYVVDDYQRSAESPEEFLSRLNDAEYFEWAYDPETERGKGYTEEEALPKV